MSRVKDKVDVIVEATKVDVIVEATKVDVIVEATGFSEKYVRDILLGKKKGLWSDASKVKLAERVYDIVQKDGARKYMK